MRAKWVCPVLLIAVAGCDFFGLGENHDPALRIIALQDAVPAGGIQEIRSENRGNRSIYFNPCPSVFERRIGGAWIPLPETRPEACPDHLEELPAKTNGGFVMQVPGSLAAGTYRIVFETFWFREEEPRSDGLIEIVIHPLPLEQRTTDRFEVIEVLPVHSTSPVTLRPVSRPRSSARAERSAGRT